MPKEAACCVPATACCVVTACGLLPVTVNVTEPPPGKGSPVDAVTVRGPGVGPRMRVVLAVAPVIGPLVGLTGGEKVSPGTLLVQPTVPQGPGATLIPLQLTETAKVLPFADRKVI